MSRRRPARFPRSKIPIRLTSYRNTPGRAAAPPEVGAHLVRWPPRRPRAPVVPSSLEPPVIERDRVSLTLPVPPSINHQYATVNGRRLLSAAGRDYKAVVGRHILLAMAKSADRRAVLAAFRSGSLSLSLSFYFTSALRRDVDGGLKITQDALCEALGLNDNRITETHLYKRQDAERPRVEVILSRSLGDPTATS